LARSDDGRERMKQEALRLLGIALNDPAAVFHPGQWEAIEALVERRERLLVVQRTGWGKSVIYFLATRLLRDRDAGCTLLISPLLALMRNHLSGTLLLNYPCALSEPSLMATRRSGPTRRLPPTP